ncbi:MAG TPA: hypothetical protein VFN25_01230, partial [Dokdonella sp.]|uniref:hypothetical protein n=1 Tax=Dokdonella sp. TaxID=2291710 RepID=UPI002D7EC290
GNADQVAQPSWHSEGSPVVLRGEVKAGCLDQPRGAAGGPSGCHLFQQKQSVRRHLSARSSLVALA